VPASNAGASPKVFWWVMIFGTSLVLYLGWPFRWSNTPTATIPITGSEPTGIPVTPTAETLVSPTPAPLVDVIVKAENANAFDSFDIRDVVIRVSDSSEVDSGADGQLRVHCALEQSIWAWAPGYGISSVKCDGQKTSYELTLTHLAAVDNSNYLWLPAVQECNNCHGNQLQNVADASYDEVNEWFRSGHGKVFDGKYFESMYTGSSSTGKMSQPAEPVIIDNEWVPVPAEKSNDYHGPGFQLDFPGQTGNCAYCHVPASLTFTQESMDLSPFFSQMGGAWAEGVTCDVCHKVFDVILDDRNFPFTNRPGILSYQFLRPNTGVFMTGPFSNVLTKRRDGSIINVNHHSTCSPLFSRSEFCAPCHFGKFGDMVIYNSYGEWRASSFAANPEAAGYRTCQDCHMSHMDVRDGTSVPSERQACSANNRKFQNFDHNMMDFGPDSEHGKEIEIPRMVKGAARLDVTFGSQAAGPNTLDVNVTVTNIKAGHKFPTDSPLRHLILVVEAEDRVNTPLIHVGGDRIPNWAGPGPLSPLGIVGTMNELGISDYSGLPGKIFANLMVEEGTNLSPAMAYWNEMKYTFVDSADGRNSDTRLVPAKPDSSTYSFTMPDVGEVEITVRLIYRYAFYDLVIWKEWFDKRRADIVVTEWRCEGPPTQPDELGRSCKPIEPPTP
jgi:hypothetical protein